ncbi:ROK family protein [Streptomyces sp. NPDC050625]|uniref:ROK family transcriptional regulator n=1 Tax=Streptomyces sp. NPDC050625 TaxID=3154629 RepID=UPI0034459998
MPASPSTARAINDRLALRLLQREGPLTAGQLKQLTGLSRPTVADLVERLTASGLITVVGEAGEQRRGPNARLYGIVADRAHLAALDVRTASVSVLVSDLLGRVLAEAAGPIGGDTGTGPALEQATALVERAVKEAQVEHLHTVGIGAPGLIDPATGELRDSAGLPAWHRRLVAALQERFPEARVSVENETNLAALAEQEEGVARDRDTFVLLWLGHSPGAAVVLDGSLRRGASGGTGEIGFLPVPGTRALPSATDCEGGYHSLVGSTAIVQLATDHGLWDSTADPSEPGAVAGLVRGLVQVVGDAAGRGAGGAGADGGEGHATSGRGDGGAERLVSARSEGDHGGGGGAGLGVLACGEGGEAGDVGRVASGVGGVGDGSGGAGREAVRHGEGGDVGGGGRGVPSVAVDPVVAARFLDDLAERIALGVASVVAILDPGCVVLGGEVGKAGGEVLARRVEERIRRMSPLVTEVRASGLGGSAVLRGALLTARERAQDELFAPPER